MAYSLKNYICIITGGTGSLGKEVVRQFVMSGAKVVTNYRDEKKFANLKEFCGNPDNLTGIRSDMISEGSVRDFFQEFSKQHQRLDVFIHTTGGFWMDGEIGETSLEKWDLMMNLNLNSTFLGTREAFVIMKKQCSGKIFTVAARSAVELPGGQGAYAVSKAGVIALTEILAKEGKQYDIHANAILPSIIDTPANRKSMPDADYSKWVTPKEIAVLLAHLSQAEVQVLSQTALKIYGKA
jgi:NAD(P)-dependent dehydrogenase (short-subunit alcohol dehydrogenase family)